MWYFHGLRLFFTIKLYQLCPAFGYNIFYQALNPKATYPCTAVVAYFFDQIVSVPFLTPF